MQPACTRASTATPVSSCAAHTCTFRSPCPPTTRTPYAQGSCAVATVCRRAVAAAYSLCVSSVGQRPLGTHYARRKYGHHLWHFKGGAWPLLLPPATNAPPSPPFLLSSDDMLQSRRLRPWPWRASRYAHGAPHTAIMARFTLPFSSSVSCAMLSASAL